MKNTAWASAFRVLAESGHRRRSEGANVADAVAMEVALDPDLVPDNVRCYVDIETRGVLTLSATVADTLGMTNREPNVTLERSTNVTRFKALLLDAAGG